MIYSFFLMSVFSSSIILRYYKKNYRTFLDMFVGLSFLCNWVLFLFWLLKIVLFFSELVCCFLFLTCYFIFGGAVGYFCVALTFEKTEPSE